LLPQNTQREQTDFQAVRTCNPCGYARMAVQLCDFKVRVDRGMRPRQVESSRISHESPTSH
jgi:hypothetical protein